MSDLKPADTRILERILSMGQGYVLDFSNRTFSEFFEAELNIDIDEARWSERGGFKANRMRAFWQLADNRKVAKLLKALWLLREENNPELTDSDRDRYFAVIARLEGASYTVRTDAIEQFVADETLEELIAAIERDIQADVPHTALDRLHTYCMKKFAHLLAQDQPGVQPAATLNGRAGQYLNVQKRAAKTWRPVSFEIMTATVKIFEQFNDVRNNASSAHDNTLIAKAEARFIFDGVANLLRFLKATEGQKFGV
ncbi:hypothetical protein BH10PSE4_BH10PSE4_21730 [soil metagenome]